MITIPYISDDGRLLSQVYPDDAGLDLPTSGSHGIQPHVSIDLPTGIRVAIPEGYYGRITGRSSSHRKLGLTVREGIIDAGFRGELFAYVTNDNLEPVIIQDGQRVAQLIICPLPSFQMLAVETLPPSDRDTKGFGSSGR